MKKAKVTFLPIGGSGALHLDFQNGFFGNAVEALHGEGVGFFSFDESLMGVTFDDVAAKSDHQTLEFGIYRIEVKVKNGKVAYNVEEKKPRPKKRAA